MKSKDIKSKKTSKFKSRIKNSGTDETGKVFSTIITLSLEEKIQKALSNPDKYVIVGTHLLDRIWAENHPEKVDEYIQEAKNINTEE